MKTPPPTIDGIGPSSHRLPVGSWNTVFDFLLAHFPNVAGPDWVARMQQGHVTDETGAQITPHSLYRAGSCIYYYRKVESEPHIPFTAEILYEDDHLLAVDKPHFLPVIPAGRFLRESLLVRLKNSGRPESLVPIHRLDRATAGVVLFSVNPRTRGRYTALFRERKVRKVYEAMAATPAAASDFPITRRSRIVTGEPFFRMQEVAGEANAETQIHLLDLGATGTSTYELRPVSGKKHQLRLHMAALGIPILNDGLYPAYVTDTVAKDDFLRPLKLLAKSIAFEDPVSGKECFFETRRIL